METADFRELVNAARSCRRFEENKALSMNDLEWLIDCARLAPSGANAQVARYVLVSKGDTLDKLFALTRWAGALKDWGGPHPGERPTGFIAVLMPEKSTELMCFDVGIASQTIQLACTSKGWGCCMIKSFDAAPAASLLNIPEKMQIALVLGLGIAKEKRMIAPLPADGSTKYWRDEDGVHYVPKRDLKELIVGKF